MATNPMQRKARNSFLLGMLITLLIAAIIIGLLFMQLMNMKKKEKEQIQNSVQVYVLTKDIASGETITKDMLEMKTVNKNNVPSNAFSDISVFSNYQLEDTNGNQIKRDNNGMYIEVNGTKTLIKQDANGNYYKEENGQNVQVQLKESPLVAKVALKENTVLTLEMVAKNNEKTTDDLREQEYNMLMLPSDLADGDYIDVRLTLPSGEDYIVVSKKKVALVKDSSGAIDANTIKIKLKEEETLAMSNAIVEAYIMKGSKIYVNKYVEPGLQADSTPTYTPSKGVVDLIDKDPNITQTAKEALFRVYNSGGVDQRNNQINAALNQYSETAKDNIESNIETESKTAQELRKKYLDSLAGVTTEQ